MKKWRRIAVIGILAAAPSFVQAKQLAVVTDAANNTSNLSAPDLIKIFNAHTRTWPDGKPVTVVVRDPGASQMQIVLHKLFNMTPAEAREFVQSHRGSVIVADSDESVIRFVAATRGAIGVVDLYSLTKDVRVLKIDGKLPVEQGYLLKGN